MRAPQKSANPPARDGRTGRRAAAILVTAAFLAGGCATPRTAPVGPTFEKADAREGARGYQEAVNAGDLSLACLLASERMRLGALGNCFGKRPASARPASTEAPLPPDAYPHADPDAPALPDTGPVTVSSVLAVPAAADGSHPAGYGAVVTYTSRWPGKPTSTRRHVVRMVHEYGWVVDQHENIPAGAQGRESLVINALFKKQPPRR